MLRSFGLDNVPLILFLFLALVTLGCVTNPPEGDTFEEDLFEDGSLSGPSGMPDPPLIPIWYCNGTYVGGFECGVNQLVVSVSEGGEDISVGGVGNEDIEFRLIEDIGAPEGEDAVIVFDAGGDSCAIRCSGMDGARITVRCTSPNGGFCEQTLHLAN